MANTAMLQTLLNMSSGIFKENAAFARAVWSDVAENPTNGTKVTAKDEIVSVKVPTARTAKTLTPGTFTAVAIEFLNRQFTLANFIGDEFALDDNEVNEMLARGYVAGTLAESIKAVIKAVEESIAALWYKIPNFVNATGAIADLASAQEKLDNLGTPPDQRTLILSPKLQWALAQLATLNANAGAPGVAGGVLQTGRFGQLLGMAVDMSQRCSDSRYDAEGTLATTDTPIVKAGTTPAVGDATLTITCTGDGKTIKQGETMVITGDTQVYSVTADTTITTGATGAAIPISPALRVAVAASAAITIARPTTAYSRCDLLLHKYAIGLVSRRMAPPDADANNPYAYYTDPSTGLVIAIEKERYAGQTRYRLGCLYGVGVINENAGCRLQHAS